MSKQQKILEILRSGDFTIAYHDRDCCYLYKGKHDYDHLPKKFKDFDGWSEGYIPVEVKYLVEALRGKVETI